MVKKVFILGNHIQALGLARQIKTAGVEAYLYTNTRLSIAKYSNTLKQTILFRDNEILLTKIMKTWNSEKDTLLFPTNDEMVNFLRSNYNTFSEKFYLGIPKPETIDIFYNKRKTYQFAENHRISIPESWYPVSMDDVIELSEKVEYPVVIKPAIMHSFHKIFGKKAYRCDSKDMLLKKVQWLSAKLPIGDLLIQEYLEGGARMLYSYGTFAVDGKPVVSVIANRIRQNPMDFGNSTTFARTCNIPEIKQIAEEILKLTDYYGLAEIEFMYDLKSHQYKFLEINTRAWKWHSISDALGFSFIGVMISKINQSDFREDIKLNAEIAWVERLTDFTVILKEFIKGSIKLRDVIETYRIPKVYAVWSLADIKPFIMYLILSPILFIKRH